MTNFNTLVEEKQIELSKIRAEYMSTEITYSEFADKSDNIITTTAQRVREATIEEERQQAQEREARLVEETAKEMNRLFIDWLQNNIGSLATEALEKALTLTNKQ